MLEKTGKKGTREEAQVPPLHTHRLGTRVTALWGLILRRKALGLPGKVHEQREQRPFLRNKDLKRQGQRVIRKKTVAARDILTSFKQTLSKGREEQFFWSCFDSPRSEHSPSFTKKYPKPNCKTTATGEYKIRSGYTSKGQEMK